RQRRGGEERRRRGRRRHSRRDPRRREGRRDWRDRGRRRRRGDGDGWRSERRRARTRHADDGPHPLAGHRYDRARVDTRLGRIVSKGGTPPVPPFFLRPEVIVRNITTFEGTSWARLFPPLKPIVTSPNSFAR